MITTSVWDKIEDGLQNMNLCSNCCLQAVETEHRQFPLDLQRGGGEVRVFMLYFAVKRQTALVAVVAEERRQAKHLAPAGLVRGDGETVAEME